MGNDRKFLTEFSLRLKDCFQQNWHDRMVSTDNLAPYSVLKCYHEAEIHILSMESRCRVVLLKLRAGVSWVKVRRFRFKPDANVSCQFCPGELEDEYHVLFQCPAYDTLRPQFLKCQNFQSNDIFCSILTSNDIDTLRSVAVFYFQAMKINLISAAQ